MSDHHFPQTTEPLRVAIRRLRWFRTAFAQQLAEVTAETGVRFTLDDRKLAAAFVQWLRHVEAQKPGDRTQRRAYFDFASGLMLRELLRDLPITAGPLPLDADLSRAEYYWPEGFACTVFCLNMHAAVVEQEFDASTTTTPKFFDIRHWWSFRENVTEDANTAIGFFDVFVGLEPEWQIPDSFRLRLDRALIAKKNAERLSA